MLTCTIILFLLFLINFQTARIIVKISKKDDQQVKNSEISKKDDQQVKNSEMKENMGNEKSI